MKLQIILFTCWCCSLFCKEVFFDLTQNGLEQYQDIWVKGKVFKQAPGYLRFGNERFAIVDSELQKYKRAFTMLDIGASQGYFSFRCAEKYPQSTFVMLEGSNPYYRLISKQLASICTLNNHLTNVIWLDRSIIEGDLIRLSQCEHFDVVLAFNILHWFKDSWQNLFDAIHQMSHVAIFEVPPVESNNDPDQRALRGSLHSFLSSKASRIKKGVPRHTNPQLTTTFYIIENNKPFLIKRSSFHHSQFHDRELIIYFDYIQKYLQKTPIASQFPSTTTEWFPGINLMTYLHLNGKHPSRKTLCQYIPVDKSHRDWMANNMVVQGNTLLLIVDNSP